MRGDNAVGLIKKEKKKSQNARKTGYALLKAHILRHEIRFPAKSLIFLHLIFTVLELQGLQAPRRAGVL